MNSSESPILQFPIAIYTIIFFFFTNTQKTEIQQVKIKAHYRH